MFGGVQLVLGCVEQCCLFALGGNLEPPPPVQHDAHAHRGSDHDHSRGRPPVRDDGGQDGNAHAGEDRMPLGARSPLHVFTLTAVEHHELTPWIRFGNRQSAHELATKAQGATTSSSRTRPIRSRSTNRNVRAPICRRPLDDVGSERFEQRTYEMKKLAATLLTVMAMAVAPVAIAPVAHADIYAQAHADAISPRVVAHPA